MAKKYAYEPDRAKRREKRLATLRAFEAAERESDNKLLSLFEHGEPPPNKDTPVEIGERLQIVADNIKVFGRAETATIFELQPWLYELVADRSLQDCEFIEENLESLFADSHFTESPYQNIPARIKICLVPLRSKLQRIEDSDAAHIVRTMGKEPTATFWAKEFQQAADESYQDLTFLSSAIRAIHEIPRAATMSREDAAKEAGVNESTITRAIDAMKLVTVQGRITRKSFEKWQEDRQDDGRSNRSRGDSKEKKIKGYYCAPCQREQKMPGPCKTCHVNFVTPIRKERTK